MPAPESNAVQVTNSEFLRTLAQGAPNGTSLWVTSFPGSPDLTDVHSWAGRPYMPVQMAAVVDAWAAENTYFAVGALAATADGELRRRKANFVRLLVLVVDDVLLEDIQGSVSYVLETSPAKTQVGIFLDSNDPDAANMPLVDKLVTTMAEKGLLKGDVSGNNAVRYVRLPVGQNQKPRESGAWTHRMLRWAPSTRMSLADAAGAFGIDLDALRAAASTSTTTGLAGLQDERLRVLTSNVVRGENLHDSVNQIAASLVATGMPGGAVVNTLRGLMDASLALKDERWLARYQDIPRSVTTAQEKYMRAPTAVPTVASDLLLSISDLQIKASAVRWAVKHVVPEHGLGFIYGASGAFKSFIALDYALHRAYGLKWMGRKTKQADPVYLAAEGGAGLMRRIEAWHQQRGMDWRQCTMRVVVVALTLRTQSSTLRDAIVASGVGCGDLIVDTMSQTFTGNENSNDEVADFLRVLGSDLRDALGCTVTVVHHSGHSATERPRGASAIVSNVDFAFGVFRDEKEMLATVEFAKVKDAERPEAQTFSLTVQELGKDEDGDAITSLCASHINGAEALLEAHQREAEAGRGGRYEQFCSLLQTGLKEKELRHAFYSVLPEMAMDAKKKAFYDQSRKAQRVGLFEFGSSSGSTERIVIVREAQS